MVLLTMLYIVVLTSNVKGFKHYQLILQKKWFWAFLKCL